MDDYVEKLQDEMMQSGGKMHAAAVDVPWLTAHGYGRDKSRQKF